jgi:MFS transporter, SP family, solute carrier family 2 (facilitated glucose transporter), member 3
MKQWCNETLLENYDWQLTDVGLETLWSSVVSIFLVGGVIGSLGGAWLADRLGR